MHRLTVMLLCAGLIAVGAACEGPTGPPGPAGATGPPGPAGATGPPGADAALNLYTGVLAGDGLVEGSYWEIAVGQDLDDWLVIVLVRSGAEYAWFEPDWDILRLESGLSTVAIYPDGEVAAGYEYRIAVAEY